MLLRLIWVILFTNLIQFAIAAEKHFIYNYAMASQCKEHISKRGYLYDQFYSIYSEDSKTKFPPGVALEMHISIQAASNGHILLSPVPSPSLSDPVYEIVVGGGGNKFTELRRNLKRNAKTSEVTMGILSAIELRGFFIKISTNGLVEFGKENETLPILSYVDVDPLDIKYFSFASWSGVEAKFLYDCPAPEDFNQTLPNSKAIERKMSNSDRLKMILLQDRPAHLAPGPNVDVSLGVSVTAVRYDAHESKMTTSMSLLMTWRDESLSWYPPKFQNVTSLNYRQGQIWRPIFHVYNSDILDPLRTNGHEVINMVSSGEATFHFKAVVDTWCYIESPRFNKWPHDKYICPVIIEPWEAQETIKLSIIDESEPILEQFADADDLTINEWAATDWTQHVVTPEIWSSYYKHENNLTHQSDRIIIRLKIERSPASHNIVFYTPLLVLMLFVLMSFWNEPLQMSRVWFYSGCSIVVSLALCYIDYLIPCHTVPSIVVLYMTVLGGVLIALLTQVILMHSVTEFVCKTALMQNVLSSSIFRAVFCLPGLQRCSNYNTINEGFLSQEEDDANTQFAPRNGNVEEMQSENTKYCERVEFAEAIDKTMFVVYSVTFAVMLGMHY